MNGLSSSRNGKKKIRHLTTGATSVDTVGGSSSQMKSHSVTLSPGRETRLVYSTRLTFSQNMMRVTDSRVADILNPK